jgi:hypothetical protein
MKTLNNYYFITYLTKDERGNIHTSGKVIDCKPIEYCFLSKQFVETMHGQRLILYSEKITKEYYEKYRDELFPMITFERK